MVLSLLILILLLYIHPIYTHESELTINYTNAGVFEKYALQKADEIFANNNIAVVVGGTGLYVKTFCQGIDNIPSIPLEIRNKLTNDYLQNGLSWLQQEVEKLDPQYYAKGEIQNPQRLLRALEVIEFTGLSIIEFQQQKKVDRNFNSIKIGLQLPREDLYSRINNRVDEMINEGLLKEVEKFLAYKDLNALQTVGYTELFNYFENKISFDRAIELIKQNTRHYAKRQLTWFKKDEEIKWLNATEHPKAQLLELLNLCSPSMI